MRTLHFVSYGPKNTEALMDALSGHGRRQLELAVESWVQNEKEDKSGKEKPFRADYSGWMTLAVERFSRLMSESDPSRLIPGGVPVVNLFARIGSLETVGTRLSKRDDLYQRLRAGMRVRILYDYIGGFGVIASATGREYDDVARQWQTWSVLAFRWLYYEARVKNTKERKTLEEYQERLRELDLPERLISNRDLMEALRMF